MQIIAIATLVASTQAGLIGAPAISTHGLALGPALAAPAYATHAFAAPAYAAPAYASHSFAAPAIFKAPIAAPAIVKAAPSIDYVVSAKYIKIAELDTKLSRTANYFSVFIACKKYTVNVGRKLLSFLSKKDIGEVVLG